MISTRLILITLGIAYLSCNGTDSINEVVDKKISHFKNYGMKLFCNYQITPFRKGKKSSFEIRRFDQNKDFAVVKLNPSPIIEKNFRIDPISIFFVQKFKTLDCYYFVCIDSFVRIDFKHNKDNYVLYKGTSKSKLYMPLSIEQAVPVNSGWKLIHYTHGG
ncbi:MAG: hypothetical protein IPM36_19855 [Lewinellaceae bacterium]|nr:hypothetical protein [Lewinellaceae bacterium]